MSLVPSGQTGQGLIAVSSGQFIRQPMTGSIQIPSSGQHGILQMQSVSSMATIAKQQTATTPQSAVLSTPSIVSRLVQPNSFAQVTGQDAAVVFARFHTADVVIVSANLYSAIRRAEGRGNTQTWPQKSPKLRWYSCNNFGRMDGSSGAWYSKYCHPSKH